MKEEWKQSAAINSSGNPPGEAPVSISRLNRRMLIIPALFLLLIVFTLGYSLQTLSHHRSETMALDLVARQRALRARLVSDVILQSQGIPRDYHAHAGQLHQIYKILLDGGRWQDGGEAIDLPPAPDAKVREEIVRKVQLIQQLEQQADRLMQQPKDSAPYRQVLQQLAATQQQLDDPTHNLVEAYIQASRSKIDNLIWLELLTVLLTAILGLALALQQRKADTALLENEERFRQIFDAAPIGKALVSPAGRWFKVNPAMCRMLGYAPDELIGRSFEQMTHPEDARVERPLRERLVQGEINQYTVTKRYYHKDGHPIWTQATVASVRDSGGRLDYVVVQLTDITEQKLSLERLEASEARYRGVIESASDGILVTDIAGRIRSANSQAGRLFGYTPEALHGMRLETLMPEPYLAMSETGLARLNGQTLELSGRRADGSEFPAEISLASWTSPVADSIGERNYTVIVRDSTERKRYEQERRELLQSNKDLEEFALIASHDLQEPLRKISFYTERFAANADRLDGESQEFLEKIMASTARMRTLITDLLAYSRVSTRGRSFMPISLNDAVSQALGDLEVAIEESGAHVEVGKLPSIEADMTQMRQLFANLVENALKYRRSGLSPEIHVYATVLDTQILPGSSQSPLVEIRVEDNGIGFEEKYLDRIFKVFQRLHSRGEYPGTGIGLATCRRIVERHKGHITATSKPGQGSVFIVTLPVRQTVAAETVGIS